MNLQDSGIVKCGTLTKSPPLDAKTRRRWHARYFVLYDPARKHRDSLEYNSRGSFHRAPSFSARASRCLQRKNTIEEPSFLSLLYYKDEDSKKKGQAAINTITLEGSTVKENPEPIRGYKYVINLNTETRLYHLCADTQEEHNSWLQALQKTLGNKEPAPTTSSSSSAPEISKKGSSIAEVPPEQNSMIQQLIEWKRERLLMEQHSKEEENAETMWLENRMMADIQTTTDDKKKDSGFSEKYGLYNSNNDVTEGNGGEGNHDDSGEAFQDRIHRLSLEAMQEKNERFSRSRTLQRTNTSNCYENVSGTEYLSNSLYTKTKVGRSRSVDNSSQYYKNMVIRNPDEGCTESQTGRPYSNPDPSHSTNDIMNRPNLQWQCAISDDGFEEEESEEDEAPALPVKSYSKPKEQPLYEVVPPLDT